MSRINFRSLNNSDMFIAPSLLAADFACLRDDIDKTKDADVKILHVDVMDGHFVPNISIGIPVVASMRKVSDQLFDVHLMITNPLKYIDAFHKAGSDHITFHVESDDDPVKVINEIRARNMSVGMTLKPGTPFESLDKYIELIDMVLIMTVEPGFGGQSFMKDMMPKIEHVRKMAQDKNRNLHIEVDGGIDLNTIGTAAEAGANIFVAGTSVFKDKNRISASAEELLKKAFQISGK